MNPEAEKKLRKLSSNQARVLETYLLHPSRASGASGMAGPVLGATLSSLQRGGILQPIGREGRQFRWEVADEDISKDWEKSRKEMLDLLNRLKS